MSSLHLTLHDGSGTPTNPLLQEIETVTKKEIVKQISDRIHLTQLKTKEIVQLTFDAIVDTLLEAGRIELRNFGVFEVKQRKARKARNPRTGDRVDVPPKFVVTFKPGKEMEERVRQMTHLPVPAPQAEEDDEEGELVTEGANGHGQTAETVVGVSKSSRSRHS
jgi:nucleoid DNA-binding protein